MIIGVPKEIKIHENRVGLVPTAVRELVSRGHKVIVQHEAGIGLGIADADYDKAGAIVSRSPEEIFDKAEMIIKVQSPQPREYEMLREEQILFAYLNLAIDSKQTSGLKSSGCVAIAYETVTDSCGKLPLLAPMSEVAGYLSIQVGAHALEKKQGGSGVLLGGVPGVPAGVVVIIGAGVVGVNAMLVAIGVGARVIMIDEDLSKLREINFTYGSQITTVYSNADNIRRYVSMADLVIGAVLLPGASTPKLFGREVLRNMMPGSVLVDVSIDQGGCFETSKPTNHDEPTYVDDGIVHYCVTNMASAVPKTATLALNNATLPFIIALADKGYKKAFLDDSNLLNGLNVYKGQITCEAVANDLGCRYTSAVDAITTG